MLAGDRGDAVVTMGWHRLGAVGLLVGVLMGALALPARPATVEQLRERFEHTKAQLEASDAALDEVDARVEAAHTELVTVGRRLDRARARRARLQRQLGAAVREQERADNRLIVAELRLGQATM